MKKISFLLILAGSLLVYSAVAQPPNREYFQATWNFDPPGLTGTSSRTAVVASPLTSNATISTVPNTAYPNSDPPGSGKALNITSWVASCGTKYAEVTVTPQPGKDITVTHFDITFTRSNNGPARIVVTSSAIGYSLTTPVYSKIITTSTAANTAEKATISLVGAGYSNQTGPVTFRIIGCDPVDGNGALRLDDIVISGDVALPADIISFTARADNQQVRLDWATSWERNADRFVAEASTDLRQFRRVGEVSAAGTTDQRQRYTLTDETPAPGPNYYRLAQIDRDGSVHYTKVISAIVRPNAPIMLVTPNPADRQQITLQLPATDAPALTVLDMLGRTVAGRLVMGSGTGAAFVPDRPLTAGRYWLRLVTPTGSTGVAVLVP